MFSVERAQELWPPDDAQGGSLVSSISGPSRSELENYTLENTAENEPSRSTSAANGTQISFKIPGVLRTTDVAVSRNGHRSLPPEKAFSIQIGWKLFRLSGASIMSDAPSYFSTYFEEQVRQEENGGGPLKTLFIDRDPETFADICRHLQGYWIIPHDSAHYVRLYADAQFYSLPRLVAQLFEAEICVSIGGQQFQIPRDTFAGPGNSSNFFSLGFAGFLSSRDDAFPGLEPRGLLRPPAIPPQSVPNRSPSIFADLIDIARGYQLDIRDADHRAALAADSKYYGLKGLMHRIFIHDISYNAERNISEIVMRLEDLHKSGISFLGDASPSDASPSGGWVNYSRPFVDETSYEVIVEIGEGETKIDWRSMRAVFYGVTKARISSLFQVVADKMNLPSNLPLGLMMSSGGASAAPASPANTPLSEDRVKIRIGSDTAILLDGQEHIISNDDNNDSNDNTSSNFLQPFFPPGEDPSADDTPSSNPSSASTTRSSTTNFRTQQLQQPAHSQPQPPPSKKRKRDPAPRHRGSLDEFGEWIIRRGQWRLRVQPKADPAPVQSLSQSQPQSQSQVGGNAKRGVGGTGSAGGGGLGAGSTTITTTAATTMGSSSSSSGGSRMNNNDDPGGGSGMEIILVAVRLDAVSGQRGRNAGRGFLG